MNALLKKVVAEFLGVMFFVTSITAATTSGVALPQLSLAITLGLMILLTAGVSGGHLNPVVSLYFLARRALTPSDFVAYVVAQLLGGVAGAWLGSLLWGKGIMMPASDNGATAAHVTAELLATAGLVWLVGTLAKTNRGAIIPVAVGAWVLAAAIFTPTGAQANPAVSIGLLFHPLGGHPLGTQMVLILAQLAGALVAVVLVNLLDEKANK